MKALYPLEAGSPFSGTYPNSADPVQTPRTSASDHGLQSLLTGISKLLLNCCFTSTVNI